MLQFVLSFTGFNFYSPAFVEINPSIIEDLLVGNKGFP